MHCQESISERMQTIFSCRPSQNTDKWTFSNLKVFFTIFYSTGSVLWNKICSQQNRSLAFFCTKSRNNSMKLAFEGKIVSLNEKCDILGVLLHRKLCWTSHTRHISQKASFRFCKLKTICRMFWGISRHTMRLSRIGAVMPVLNFAALSWSTVKAGRLRLLAKIQRRGTPADNSRNEHRTR